jgi:hypothetical protein
MVTNTDPRNVHFAVHTDPPTETDNIVWYGFNPVELEQYGDYRYDYETTRDFKLIDMGSAETLKALYDLFAEDPQAQNKLAKGFGFDPQNPTVVGLRRSEEADDVIVAHFLQKLLASTEFRGYALVGAKMRSVLGEGKIVPFHPEICLVISPEDDTKLLTAVDEDLMGRLKQPPPVSKKKQRNDVFDGSPDSARSSPPSPTANFDFSALSPSRRLNLGDSPSPTPSLSRRLNLGDSPPRKTSLLLSYFNGVASDSESDRENKTPNSGKRGGGKKPRPTKTCRRSQKRRTRRLRRRRTPHRSRNAGTRRYRRGKL